MNQYTSEWFKQRARNSFKKIEEGKWDYSDSLLLYLPQGATEYEKLQDEGGAYFELVTKPERDYLQTVAADMAKRLPNHFEYIDLGPGTEHKEQFLFDALRALGKSFTYTPVDISEHFLSLAEQHAAKQGIPTRPEQGSFEELVEKLGAPQVPRLVSLGLTFSNYNPHELFALLRSIAGRGGVIFVDAHMRDRVDMTRLQQIYAEDARSFVVSKLDLLGVNAATDVAPPEIDDGIQVWSTIRKVTPVLAQKGVQAGDRVLLFQSLRYTKETFEQAIAVDFKKYDLFDTGAPFVGALLWTD